MAARRFSSESSSVILERIEKLWPWVLNTEKTFDLPSQIEDFYRWTYTIGKDDYILRIEEGADDEESWHGAYVMTLCLEFGLDGKAGKPSISQVWHDIHKFVICPLFKKGCVGDVYEQLVNYPSKTYALNKDKVQVIWDAVKEWGKSNVEVPMFDLFIENMYDWLMKDREHQFNVKYKTETHNPNKQEKIEKSVSNKQEKEEKKSNVHEKISIKNIMKFKPKPKLISKQIESSEESD